MYYFYALYNEEWVLIGGGDFDFCWELATSFYNRSSVIIDLGYQKLGSR